MHWPYANDKARAHQVAETGNYLFSVKLVDTFFRNKFVLWSLVKLQQNSETCSKARKEMQGGK